MIELRHKYIVGTQVMFYEIEMLSDFIDSVRQSLKHVSNKQNVTIDMCFNISQYFEKIDTTTISKDELLSKFMTIINGLESDEYNVKYSIYENDEKPRTMVEYRRDLNYYGCQDHDYVIWGETDCLLPNQCFEVLDSLMTYAHSNNIYNYITTFATRKMWDDSWKVLEHVDFTDKPFHSMKTELELAETMPYSIRYNMSIDEMNKINNKVDRPDIQLIHQPKFDGSCLIISSNLIKAGANIPPGIFGLVAEDTAFMYSCQQILGKGYTQFVVKNILKVHNRMHKLKRRYTNTTQNDKGDAYNSLRELNRKNLQSIFSNGRALSYKDWKYYESKN